MARHPTGRATAQPLPPLGRQRLRVRPGRDRQRGRCTHGPRANLSVRQVFRNLANHPEPNRRRENLLAQSAKESRVRPHVAPARVPQSRPAEIDCSIVELPRINVSPTLSRTAQRGRQWTIWDAWPLVALVVLAIVSVVFVQATRRRNAEIAEQEKQSAAKPRTIQVLHTKLVHAPSTTAPRSTGPTMLFHRPSLCPLSRI